MATLNLDRYQGILMLQISGAVTEKDIVVFEKGVLQLLTTQKASNNILIFNVDAPDVKIVSSLHKMVQAHKAQGIDYDIVSSILPFATHESIEEALDAIKTGEAIKIREILDKEIEDRDLSEQISSMNSDLTKLIAEFFKIEQVDEIDEESIGRYLKMAEHQRENLENTYQIYSGEVKALLRVRESFDAAAEDERLPTVKNNITKIFIENKVSHFDRT